jgi:segregation and condensation protein A
MIPKISETETESYSVKLDVFEGPLDLLLHLIRVNEIDIYDIPIVEITRQYNDYLDLMKEMNFEIAGEFLVMAATLLYIKSKTLLPREQVSLEEEEKDPRAELTRQLLDYQRCRAASENLLALEQAQHLIWLRPSGMVQEDDGEEFIEAGLFDLIRAFKDILQRVEKRKALEIEREDVSLAEKIAYIKKKLIDQQSIAFLSLFPGHCSKREIIVIFLALLELMRGGYARTFQRTFDDSIIIIRRTPSKATEP